MFALLGGTVANFAVPALIGIVIDAMKTNDWQRINEACIVMMIIVVFSALCVWVRGAVFNIISERIA